MEMPPRCLIGRKSRLRDADADELDLNQILDVGEDMDMDMAM